MKKLPVPSGIVQFMAQLLHEFRPGSLLPALTAGLILGILNITLSTSYAALIFSGELSGYVSRGIGFILFGALIIGLIVSITSSLPNTIAVPQEIPAALFALTGATLVKVLPVSGASAGTFPTFMAIIMLTSVMAGVIFLMLGGLKLGNLTRFIPYPVIGSFLAGTGWLLLTGGVFVMTDVPCEVVRIPDFFQHAILVKWLPGVLFGVVLMIISRRYHHIMIMPLTIVAGVALFFLTLTLTDISVADAESRGWFLGPFPGGALWQPFTLADAKQIQWSAMNSKIVGNMGTIFMLGTISLLLNAAGLELTVRRDIDLNRELVSAGIANIFTGLGGGAVGFHTLSDTSLGHKIAPNSRLAGVFAATLCGVALTFGASLLSYFPRFLAGGLIIFLGLSFLVEWLYDSRRMLPKTDYILIWITLFIVVTIGFPEGVFLGMLMTIIIFVINYSRIHVVKHTLPGKTFQSNVERAAVHRRILQERRDAIIIFKLQGFIFFGTAHTLYKHIRHHVIASELSNVRFLVLDFHLVSGLDSSALHSFAKLKRFAETRGCILVLTNLLPKIQEILGKIDYFNDGNSVVRSFPDLDCGVEWCEEQILFAEKSLVATTTIYEKSKLFKSAFDDIMKSLDQQERFELLVEELLPYLEKRKCIAGDYLIIQGDIPEAIYFIESGQVDVQVESKNGKVTRLRTMNAGTVVGELGTFLKQPTTASVIMQQQGTIYRLSDRALQHMKTADPEKIIRFHEFLVHLLSERLVNTNNTLHALLD